jgi:hypothetical protein
LRRARAAYHGPLRLLVRRLAQFLLSIAGGGAVLYWGLVQLNAHLINRNSM